MMNKQLLLSQRPNGIVKNEDFAITKNEIPDLIDGQLLIENKYISLDPAMRGWMNEGTTYIRGVEIGATMRAFSAGIIIDSKNENFKIGDSVQGLFGVQKYAITDG